MYYIKYILALFECTYWTYRKSLVTPQVFTVHILNAFTFRVLPYHLMSKFWEILCPIY